MTPIDRFSNYILHPQEQKNFRCAWVVSIVLGILTLGAVHAACFCLAKRNVVDLTKNSSQNATSVANTAKKVSKVVGMENEVSAKTKLSQARKYLQKKDLQQAINLFLECQKDWIESREQRDISQKLGADLVQSCCEKNEWEQAGNLLQYTYIGNGSSIRNLSVDIAKKLLSLGRVDQAVRVIDLLGSREQMTCLDALCNYCNKVRDFSKAINSLLLHIRYKLVSSQAVQEIIKNYINTTTADSTKVEKILERISEQDKRQLESALLAYYLQTSNWESAFKIGSKEVRNQILNRLIEEDRIDFAAKLIDELSIVFSPDVVQYKNDCFYRLAKHYFDKKKFSQTLQSVVSALPYAVTLSDSWKKLIREIYEQCIQLNQPLIITQFLIDAYARLDSLYSPHNRRLVVIYLSGATELFGELTYSLVNDCLKRGWLNEVIDVLSVSKQWDQRHGNIVDTIIKEFSAQKNETGINKCIDVLFPKFLQDFEFALNQQWLIDAARTWNSENKSVLCTGVFKTIAQKCLREYLDKQILDWPLLVSKTDLNEYLGVFCLKFAQNLDVNALFSKNNEELFNDIQKSVTDQKTLDKLKSGYGEYLQNKRSGKDKKPQESEEAQAPRIRYSEQELQEAYRLLGITSSTGKEDAVQAYKRLAFKHHPDKCQNNLSVEKKEEYTIKFQKISNAWAIIKDAKNWS